MPYSPVAAPAADLAHLRLDGVSVSFADRRVLTDVNVVVAAGQRTGLIGENGSGKSTLLRVAAGLLEPDAGTVAAVAGGRTPVIGFGHQEPPFPDEYTVDEAIEMAVEPARRAARAVEDRALALADDPGAADAYTLALDEAELLGAWDVDARVGAMLDGLGLADLPRDRPTGRLSGGQRARLSLAWVLLRAPDILLLDEPTNHLDDAAADFLREVLRTWAGPVLFASHDRAFLDEVATTLVDLDPAPVPHRVAESVDDGGPGTGMGVTRFTGTYTQYLRARREARARWEQQYRDEQAELSRLRTSVRDSHVVGHVNFRPRSDVRMAKKFYADRNAKVVKRRVDDARARLKALESAQVRKPPAQLEFAGLTAAGDPERASANGPVLVASDVSVAGRLDTTHLAVGAGEKWLITGPNGVGKSTLLGLLGGRVEPDTGGVTGTARVGMLAQEVAIPDPSGHGPGRTARQAYVDNVGEDRAEQVPLRTFGLIAGRDENRPLAALSVGQQRRVALAILLADPPEVLLLDEPTNHLSLDLATALEAALTAYPGSVVVASHDRWLRRRWRGERLDLG